MFSKKEWVIFFAGAQTFHTLSHIAITMAGMLPVMVFGIEWTQQLNMIAIMINTIITAGLLLWAARLK